MLSRERCKMSELPPSLLVLRFLDGREQSTQKNAAHMPRAKLKIKTNKTTMPPIEVIANGELCMTKYGVNRLIGSKDIAKTNI